MPDKKSKPHRPLIVLVTGILTGLLGMVAAFVLEARNRAKSDPIQSKLIAELQQQLPVWRRNRKGREGQSR
jgi:hypothetical protein